MTHARRSARLVAAGVLAASLGLLVPACGSSGSDGEPSEVSLPDDAATTDVAPVTEPAEPTTTVASDTTLAAAVGLPDQEAAVQRLYDAWFADDRATAATVADETAVEGIWLTAHGDYSLYNQCSTGEFDTTGCLYRGNLGTIQFTLEKRGENWVVIEAFYSEP